MPNDRPDTGCLACQSHGVEPWAQATDIEYHSVSDVFSYLHCLSCGALFIAPVPEDRLSEIYPQSYYSYATPSRSLAYRVKAWLDRRAFRKILGTIPGESLRALDVGGGAGWELNTLRDAEPRVHRTRIVDLDPRAEQIARNNGHDYFCGRIEDFDAVERYDLVLLLNLIEHVKDPVAVLRKTGKLLTPTGRIVVKTPNHDALDARLFRHRSWAGYHCPRHWVLFHAASFRTAAERAGLRVRSISYTQGAPFWAASILGNLAQQGIVRVDRQRPVFYHPLFSLSLAVFAGFDFLRLPFSNTSQMVFVLERDAGLDAAVG